MQNLFCFTNGKIIVKFTTQAEFANFKKEALEAVHETTVTIHRFLTFPCITIKLSNKQTCVLYDEFTPKKIREQG